MRSLPELEDDHRIRRLLNDFDKRYTGQDLNALQSKSTGTISLEMMDGVKLLECVKLNLFEWNKKRFFLVQLSKQSFPLCMRHLHDTLRSTHHLKHGGRIQYGLFVKGIGLSLEQSLKFWRDEFTKNMDIDKVRRLSN